MTSGAAWRRGFAVLWSHPWLALIPMLWDLVQAGLARLGVPLGPVAGASRLADSAMGLVGRQPAANVVGFRAYLPTPLPGIGNLTVSLQPAILDRPFAAGVWPALASTLLLPLAEAMLTALFLSLIAAYVTPSSSWRWQAALERVPSLFVLFLAGRLGVMLLPMPLVIGLMGAYILFLPLLPYGLGAGRSLSKAVMEAPNQLWGHLGDWFGLGLRTLLATGLLTFLWSLAGQPVWLAELIYPFVGTGLVAAAVALYVRPEAEPAPDPEGSWAFLGSLLAAGVAAGLLVGIMGTWNGWYPTRETALQPPAPSMPMFGASPKPVIRYASPEDGGTQLVIYESGSHGQLTLTRLLPGRFGWKRAAAGQDFLFSNQQSAAVVSVAVLVPERARGPVPRNRFAWGEINDSRVAFVALKGQRFAVGNEGPFFIVPMGPEAAPSEWGPGDFVLLDVSGQPIPEGGAAR
jgi:hypothetical protein